MRNGNKGLVFCFVILLLVTLPAAVCVGDDVPRISKEELRELLGSPDLVLLDVRIVSDWRKSDVKIQGAVRVDPHDVSSWAGDYPRERKIVAYCS